MWIALAVSMAVNLVLLLALWYNWEKRTELADALQNILEDKV
jgi:hypothetical protein